MRSFLGRRILLGLVTILAITLLVHTALYLAPGDPVDFLTAGKPTTPERLAALRAEYNLDDPFFTRYFSWLGGVFSGDLGQSASFNTDVSVLLESRVPTTLYLVVMSFIMIMVFGLTLGIVAALRGGAIDTATMATATLVSSIPAFVSSFVLINVFALRLGWFPAIGIGDGNPINTLWHLVLPSLALALGASAFVARTTRASVRTELSRDHVATATVRGIPRRLIISRHVLRNGLLPILSISGLILAGLIVGTAFVEQAFAIEGLGKLLVTAARQQDLAVVQAVTLILVVAFVVLNILVDILYWYLDPRVRSESA
jgi:peptide/nickel transport system permease protein